MSDFASTVSGTLSSIGDLLTFSGGESLPDLMSAVTGNEIYPLEIGGYKFKFGALIQVKGKKNIVITEVPDAKNSYKEITGFADYELNIAGVLAFKNNKLLLEELESLINLFNGESLSIVSPYTKKFKIKKILIEDFEPIIKQGWQSCLWYTLRGYSDNEIDHKYEVRTMKFDLLKKLTGI